MNPLMNQTITLSIVLSQILNPLAVCAAGLEVDNSNARYAPSIEMAPNQKVPVVNITAPNSGGLSHNKFLNYNVSNEGLILNNSNKTLVNTQLAGYIYGNKNFAGKDTAKVILNEVTSRNRTELRGYTEVAGDKARVIVANPNGVYINGAGFINTSHATITTGTPITNQDTGNLESFRVIGGDIEIDGDGLNVSDLDRASLYSQALTLNAKLYANELDVITGDNEITPDGSNYTALVSTEPHAPMSIDSSSLGGIYANKIKLLATKDGIGVNLPIEVTASDNLYINADAQITLGTVIASNEVSITSENGSIESNTLYAKTVTLEAKEDITNQNILASSDGITLNSNTLTNANFIATGVDNNLQKINDSATLVINADTSIVQDGILFASNDITLHTNDFVNNGSIGADGTLSVTSTDAIITGNLQAKRIKTTTDNFTLDVGTLYADETLEVDVANDTNINNSSLKSFKTLSINTKSLNSSNSLIASNEDITIKATNTKQTDVTKQSNFTNTSIIGKNIIFEDRNSNLSLDVNSGIAASNNLAVKTNSITNNGIIEANKISLDSEDFSNTNTRITSNTTLDIVNKNNLKMDNSTIEAGDNISIDSANTDLAHSTIVSNQDISLINSNNLIIDSATLYADNKLQIQTGANTTITNTTIQATNNDLSLITNNMALQRSSLLSTKNITAEVKNTLSQPLNNNKILAYDISVDMANIDLSLDATNQIEATNDLSVNAKNLTNNTTLIANHDTTITTHNLTNNNLISAGNTLSVNASGNIINNSNVTGGLKGKITNIDAVNITNKGYITAQDAMNITASNTIKNIAAIGVSGDHGALALNADTILNYNTLYSSGDMTLRPVTLLKNATDATEVNLGSDVAVIYANDTMNIEGDRGKTIVENISSSIQTQTGDISITAKELVNKRSKDRNDDAFFSYTTSWGKVSYKSGTAYKKQGDLVRGVGLSDDFYVGYIDRLGYSLAVDFMRPHYGTFSATSHEKTPYDNPNYHPSLISSGKNFNINVNQVHNEISTISSAEDMIFNNSNIENYSNDYSGDLTMSVDSANLFYGHVYLNGVKIDATPADVGAWTFFYELFNDPSKRVRSTIEAKNISGVATNLQNGITTNPNVTIYRPNMNEADTTTNTATNQNITSQQANNTPSNSVPDNITHQEITYSIPSNPYGMFVPSDPNTNHDYLIEANPAYTNIGNLVNSTYFYEKMGLDTDTLTKRLGDGAYETKLVTDAILNLTGRRMITEDFTTDNAQFVKLMDNAVNVSGILGLEIGKAPSAEQLANLGEDIVWMEEKVVNGQKVLVPVIYLAKDYSHLKGANIIANDTIDLSVSGNVNNNGNLLSNNLLNLKANAITNNGGVIFSNGTAVLVSRDNVVNKNGGSIKAGEIAIASTSGSVINETSMQVNNVKIAANNDLTYTMVGKTSSIEATKGDLLIAAQKDIQNIGANLSASSNLVLATNEGDINFKALETKTGHNFYSGGGFDKALDTEHLSATAEGGANIIISSGKEINLEAARLNATDTVSLDAKESINMTALNDVHYSDVQTTKKGRFSKKTTRDMSYAEEVQSTSINAGNIVASSGGDITLQATNLKAAENIQIDAAGDINILAQAYREASLHQESKSRFGGLVKSASLDSIDAMNLREATVKTEAKNIIMNSGKDITVVASEINAAADVQLRAFENLNIIAGEEIKSEKHESQKSSFNPLGLLSLVGIDAGPIYTQDIHNKDNYDTTAKSSTIKAGGSITVDTGTTNIVGSNLSAGGDVAITADIGGINVASAQELHNASTLDKKVEVKLTDIFTSSADAYANLHSGKDTKLKFNVASATFDESTTTAQSVTNVGSSITSGKNVTLDSSDDIAIKGSDVTAKDTLTLTSTTGNIAITESVDTTNTQSSEKHASAEVNLVVQNEFVEAGVAVKNAVEAAEQLKQTKEDYSNYKREVKKLEASLETLQTQYKEKVPGIDYSDIEDLKEVISNTKEDEKYYLAAITLATADLASKTAAVASQGAAAAASTGTLGFSAGISLEMQGSKTSTDTSATHSNASNLNASNIAINTDTTADTSVTISGSNLNATDTLNIATHDLNVRSSVDTATMNSDSKQINGSITMSVYGGGASGASLGYGENHATSESEINHNSNLNANTMNINVSKDTNFKGATVRADDTLNLTVGNNLNVESVRDSSTSASHGMNASLGVSAGGNNTSLSGANASIGSNNSRSSEKQTVLTSLTGDNVNITVGENTNLKGSLIAAGQTEEVNGEAREAALGHENGVFQDNNNLNLSTKTLTFENSTNTKSSNSQGLGIGAGVNQQGDVSSVSAQVSTGTSYERTKTLATLGNGTITITDKENSDDLSRLNTDTTQVDKSLFKTETGTSASGTLDTRLLTAEGRAQIKEDYEKTKRLGEAAYETATMDSVSIIADQADGQTSFAERLNDKEALAQASKIIASQENTQLLATLTNPNATDEEKTQAYQNIVSTLSEQMGISTSEVKLILSNTEKGGYSPATDTTYIATNAQATSGDAANTLAHETSHSADAIRDAGVQTTDNYTTNREEYATLTGDDFQRYLNNAMENNGYASLNTITDNRYGTTDYTTTLQANTLEYEALDPTMVFHREIDPRLYGRVYVSETEAKQKATQLADGLASTSTQMGRISATAASVGAAQTLEYDPWAAGQSFTISGVTGWISVGSGALEQLVRPDMGKAATDTLFDLISRGVSNRYQSASLFVNETAELAKNNEITQSIQDSINGYFKGDKK